MEDLIERLEAAEVGSRELDLRVFEKFDLVDGERWSDADLEYALTDPDRTINPPRLTQSLDAALALAERVLPGQEYEITTVYNVARVALNMNHGCDGGPFYGSNDCCNVPLAICAAILRAKQIDTAQNPR